MNFLILFLELKLLFINSAMPQEPKLTTKTLNKTFNPTTVSVSGHNFWLLLYHKVSFVKT